MGLRTEVKRAAGDFDRPPGFEGARGAQLLMPLFFMTEGYGRPTGHEWAIAQGPRQPRTASLITLNTKR